LTSSGPPTRSTPRQRDRKASGSRRLGRSPSSGGGGRVGPSPSPARGTGSALPHPQVTIGRQVSPFGISGAEYGAAVVHARALSLKQPQIASTEDETPGSPTTRAFARCVYPPPMQHQPTHSHADVRSRRGLLFRHNA
jgi:hypothetical protein